MRELNKCGPPNNKPLAIFSNACNPTDGAGQIVQQTCHRHFCANLQTLTSPPGLGRASTSIQCCLLWTPANLDLWPPPPCYLFPSDYDLIIDDLWTRQNSALHGDSAAAKTVALTKIDQSRTLLWSKKGWPNPEIALHRTCENSDQGCFGHARMIQAFGNSTANDILTVS